MRNLNNGYLTRNPILWVYNYDFEFEIAGLKASSFTRPQCFPWYFLNRLSLLFLPLSKADDSILVYEYPDKDLIISLKDKLQYLPNFKSVKPQQETNSVFTDLFSAPFPYNNLNQCELQPWGWSQNALQYSSRFCLHPESPIKINDVLMLNSKQTSNHFRESCLPENSKIPSLDIQQVKISLTDLKAIVKLFQEEHPCFFVKHYFGTAGRLSDYCQSSDFSNRKLKKWKSWINIHKGLLLEEKMEIQDEWSLQIEVTPNKEVIPLTLTKMYSGRDGAYWGNLLGVKAEKIEENLITILEPIFQEILKTDYHGPIGFDFIETTGHKFKLLEINTRYTMGRIAFEWHRKLNPFPYGLFFNLFFPYSPHQNIKQILDTFLQMEKNNSCFITLVNLIPGLHSGTTLICGIIGAENQKVLWKTHQEINHAMKK